MTTPRHRILDGLKWRYSLGREFLFYFRVCENWQALVQARQNGAALQSIVLRSGTRIQCHERHSRFIEMTAFRAIWDERLYTKHLGAFHPRVIVDIGAHIGLFAIYAALQYPNARIWALEPEPENFALLVRNLEQNRLHQVKAYAWAAASETGNRPMHIASQSDGHSFYEVAAATAGSRGCGRVQVPVATMDLRALLDSIAEPVIDLLKMDCEGCEYEFLHGQTELLRRTIRFIALEYHEWNGHQKGDIVHELEAAGFSVRVKPGRRGVRGMLWAQNLNR